MKKTLVISALLLFTLVPFSVMAQKISLESGYINPGRNGVNTSSFYLNGIQVGAAVDIDLKYNFGLHTGLLYTAPYGYNQQFYPSAAANYFTVALFTDIPLRVTYSLPASETFKFFVFAGPNLNIGMVQNQIVNSTVSNIPSKNTDLYSNNVLSRYNVQLGAGAGMQWNQLILKGGYDFGLNNLNLLSTGNQYQNTWNITFAYEFAAFGLTTKTTKAETTVGNK
jgi:hypothetical protein